MKFCTCKNVVLFGVNQIFMVVEENIRVPRESGGLSINYLISSLNQNM